MKIHHLMAAIVLVFSGNTLAQAANVQGSCLQKEQEIQRQIEHARQSGNQHRVAGLEKALDGVKSHCTDEKLAAEHQDKIADQQAEIAERQRELSESKREGDPQKILKREKKLAEAEQELQALQKK
ncbi:DUF1090 domain-containing protein [Brenneria goodwinii]|uniref:Protein yqjC n=1 Tax=Brenneria goodwinii TaxID=1109412 RepID=A0A0G4JS08_9GAMM|nr:DUF1090 domain-containing protein [Brenneria goodwinii]CPR14506.1 Protein yqjC precursor [Brenneria goodwinii]